MNALVAQFFGYGIIVVAVSLVIWETFVYRRKEIDVPWLRNPVRLRRRLIMAALIFCVGLLIVAESHGILQLNTARQLLIYVCALMILSFVLLILSVRDLGDMARSAERYAAQELKLALEKELHSSNEPAGPDR